MPRRGAWRERPAPPPSATSHQAEATGGRAVAGPPGSAEPPGSGTHRETGQTQNERQGCLPPSQARSPAQQGPGQAQSTQRPGPSPVGWAGPAAHPLSAGLCPDYVHLGLPPGFGPCGGRCSSYFEDCPRVRQGLPSAPARPAAPAWPPGKWKWQGGAEPASRCSRRGGGSSGFVGNCGGIFAKRLMPGTAVRTQTARHRPSPRMPPRGTKHSLDER